MKKNGLALAFASLAIFGASQANAEIRCGLKAGLNINNVDFEHISEQYKTALDAKNRCGVTVGGTIEWTGILGLGLDVSAMYTRMNSEIDATELKDLTSSDFQKLWSGNQAHDFVEVPINLKYRLSIPLVSKIIKPMAYTGPTLAFKVSEDQSIIKTKNLQLGWNVGFGVELLENMQLGVTKSFGINNYIDNNETLKSLVDQSSQMVNYVDNIKAKQDYWTVAFTFFF